MKLGITAVILNWKRPLNVIRILDDWRASGVVSEAIVWNNNPATSFRHDWANVVNADQDLGLYTRFSAACLAQHDCLLIQDDDLLVPAESLRTLYDAWLDEPDILHGLFGRRPTPEGLYTLRDAGSGDMPIVLTRALLAARRYAAEFFNVAPNFAAIQRDGRPVGNGEDIIFSYTARRSSGRLNRAHALPVVELPAPDSIHNRDKSAHLAHRSRLLRACEAWLAEQLPDAVTTDATMVSA